MSRPNLWRTIYRSIRLRCPRCGEGRVARSWFATQPRCDACGLDFRVEGGFYLGSIYFNYGLVALITLGVGMPLVGLGIASPMTVFLVGAVACVLLPLWFWRYARSLWLGFGYYIDHNVRQAPLDAATDDNLADRHAMHLADDQPSLRTVCPYCHTPFQFAASKAGTWQQCAFCERRILLREA